MSIEQTSGKKVINLGAGKAIPAPVSVGNTSTEVLATNTSRKWCLVTNIGNKDVWMGIGQTAVSGRGILLGKQGGSMTMSAVLMSYDAVNGITASGNSDVITQEGE